MRLEQDAQSGDIRLERVARRVGRILTPDGVDQLLDRDDLACPKDEHRQHRPLLRSAQRKRAFSGLGLERPEQTKRDPVLTVRPSAS